jgi:hypothetical protein
MLRQSPLCFLPYIRYLSSPCDRCRGWQEIRYILNLAADPRSVRSTPNIQDQTRIITRHGRRSVKILPGIRLNFGKRGVSTSIGVRGAHVTFGKAGTRTAVGLPGSGLSFTHLDKPHHERSVAADADKCGTRRSLQLSSRRLPR